MEPICPLAHPASPHYLTLRKAGETPESDCSMCGKRINTVIRGIYYYCTICPGEYHGACQSQRRKILHPYHLQHPIHYVTRADEHESVTCSWCGKNTTMFFYRCSICGFCLDMHCSNNIPLVTITNPKSHHHSLSLFPRPLLVPCDACGLIDRSVPSNACLQCNYMVHESCINLPRVIKITRHQHRLSHTPYLPHTIFPCRVCFKNVDFKYGQYSCNHEDCSYVAHSKCAADKRVWDGRELEWEPEEPDDAEDIAPFKKIGVDLIKYFCHEHDLRLDKYQNVRDADKQCEACVLPIDSHDFYNCIKCDFSLHEVCANLPRKLDHASHNHPLVLCSAPNSFHAMRCSNCYHDFTGFRYKCMDINCLRSIFPFQIDVRCSFLPDCFTHKSHEHPLFIPIPAIRSPLVDQYGQIFCKSCEKSCTTSHLKCTTCDFVLCYRCAILPNELHYKHDEHPLSLCYRESESTDDKYWCEVCEKKVDPTTCFYTCNTCCITIHVDCIFEPSIYMKPGFTFNFTDLEVKVLRNNSSTRLFCDLCSQRCSSHVYYMVYKNKCRLASCSLACLRGNYHYPKASLHKMMNLSF